MFYKQEEKKTSIDVMNKSFSMHIIRDHDSHTWLWILSVYNKFMHTIWDIVCMYYYTDVVIIEPHSNVAILS